MRAIARWARMLLLLLARDNRRVIFLSDDAFLIVGSGTFSIGVVVTGLAMRSLGDLVDGLGKSVLLGGMSARSIGVFTDDFGIC